MRHKFTREETLKGAGKAGRPIGAKDRTWNQFEYWFELVEEGRATMKGKDKASIGLQGLEMLVSKLKVLPGNPGDSVANANQAMLELQAIRERQNAELTSGSSGMGDRGTELQVPTSSVEVQQGVGISEGQKP